MANLKEKFPGYSPGLPPSEEAEALGACAARLCGLADEINHCSSLPEGQVLLQRLQITAACFNAKVVALLRFR